MKHRTRILVSLVAVLPTLIGSSLFASAQRTYDRTYDRLPGQAATRLTGTYRLDRYGSDNASITAGRVTRELPSQDQQRIREVLTRRLEAPETIAIERRGRSITLASSRAQPVTFDADGVERVEERPNGRTMRVSAALEGDRLVVVTTGDRGSDYRVTFDPIDGGRRMRVTRSLDTERLDQPVTATSVYSKISSTARLNLYRGGSSPVVGRGTFLVPNDTRLIAVLNNNLTTDQTRGGERFTMTVRSPYQYNGAVIEGHVTDVNRSGRLTGHPEMSLNFDRIRLRNGRSQPFEGFIESVRSLNGATVRVNSEGTISERSGQTERTVGRTGIGAAIGAVIGAIAGGGKGAAIGAAVGAGAGAGSVFVEGRDDLELVSGTEFTLRASTPNYR
jgi:YmgG-like glycine-zipper protein